jgi:hypothetical protein
VKKGERAIAIIAPLPIKDGDKVSGKETGETRLLFKTVFVFERAQVAPLPNRTPTPLQAPCEPLTGDRHAHLIEPLVAFAESLRYTVSFESIAGAAGGWCDPKAKRIVIDADRPGTRGCGRWCTRSRTRWVSRTPSTVARAEVIVDTVTYLGCASAGLDVSGESIPYVAGWGENGALEAVSEFARTIDQLARRIEDVLAEATAREQPLAA